MLYQKNVKRRIYTLFHKNQKAASSAFTKGDEEMKSTGIVRKIDELGRIVLPIELRRSLGIEVKDPVEIFIEGEQIILRKYKADLEKEEIKNFLVGCMAGASDKDKENLQRAINLIK